MARLIVNKHFAEHDKAINGFANTQETQEYALGEIVICNDNDNPSIYIKNNNNESVGIGNVRIINDDKILSKTDGGEIKTSIELVWDNDTKQIKLYGNDKNAPISSIDIFGEDNIAEGIIDRVDSVVDRVIDINTIKTTNVDVPDGLSPNMNYIEIVTLVGNKKITKHIEYVESEKEVSIVGDNIISVDKTPEGITISHATVEQTIKTGDNSRFGESYYVENIDVTEEGHITGVTRTRLPKPNSILTKVEDKENNETAQEGWYVADVLPDGEGLKYKVRYAELPSTEIYGEDVTPEEVKSLTKFISDIQVNGDTIQYEKSEVNLSSYYKKNEADNKFIDAQELDQKLQNLGLTEDGKLPEIQITINKDEIGEGKYISDIEVSQVDKTHLILKTKDLNLSKYVADDEVVSNNVTLEWGEDNTIASIGGKEIKVTMPEQPDAADGNTRYMLTGSVRDNKFKVVLSEATDGVQDGGSAEIDFSEVIPETNITITDKTEGEFITSISKNDTDGSNIIVERGNVNLNGYLKSDALTGYATQSWVTDEALDGYATQSWVNDEALKGYATQEFVTTQGYLKSGDINGKFAEKTHSHVSSDITDSIVLSNGITNTETKLPQAKAVYDFVTTQGYLKNGDIDGKFADKTHSHVSSDITDSIDNKTNITNETIKLVQGKAVYEFVKDSLGDYIKKGEETQYVLPTADKNVLGGIKVGYQNDSNNRNYAVNLDTNGNAFVNVPWEEVKDYLPNNQEVPVDLHYTPNTVEAVYTAAEGKYISGIKYDEKQHIVGINEEALPSEVSKAKSLSVGDVGSDTNPVKFVDGKPVAVTNSFLTGITSSDVTDALGYTPLSAETKYNGSTFISVDSNTISAKTGNTAETLAVGNHTHEGVYQPKGEYLTADKTGTLNFESGKFTNETWKVTETKVINIPVNTSDLENDSNFLVNDDISITIGTKEGLTGGGELKNKGTINIGHSKITPSETSDNKTLKHGETFNVVIPSVNEYGHVSSLSTTTYTLPQTTTLEEIGAAPKTHTHTKEDITNFDHNHSKADITDFAHRHGVSEIDGMDDKIASYLAANDAMIFKGAINESANLPIKSEIGWTFKANAKSVIFGETVEIGDLIICIADNEGTELTAENFSDFWTIVQTNTDGVVVGPSSSVAENIAVFDGTSGKLIKDSGLSIKTSVPENAVFTDTNNYLTGVSGRANEIVTITREGLSDITWDARHTHGIYPEIDDDGYIHVNGIYVDGLNNVKYYDYVDPDLNDIPLSLAGSCNTTCTIPNNSEDYPLIPYYLVCADNQQQRGTTRSCSNVYIQNNIVTAGGFYANALSDYTFGDGESIENRLLTYALKSDLPGVFTGATSTADGKAGLVKAPAKGNQTCYLKGDGTWGIPTNTVCTAGAFHNAGKLYFIGAKEQTDNQLAGIVTYSNSDVWMENSSIFAQNGSVYTNNVETNSIIIPNLDYFYIGDEDQPTLLDVVNMMGSRTGVDNISDTESKLYLVGSTSQDGVNVTNTCESVYMMDGGLFADFIFVDDMNSFMYSDGTTLKDSIETNYLTVNGNVMVSGVVSGATAYYQSSDERLKDFGEDINIDFDKLKEIPKKYFTWKTDDTKKVDLGTSAQKVRELYPELVGGDDDTTLSVDYAKLSIVALKAVDKLHEENEMLRAELDMIKKHLGL